MSFSEGAVGTDGGRSRSSCGVLSEVLLVWRRSRKTGSRNLILVDKDKKVIKVTTRQLLNPAVVQVKRTHLQKRFHH